MQKMIAVALIGLTMILGACTSKTVRNPEAPKQFVFPFGTYRHDIDLEILIPEQPPKKMHFNGVAKVSSEQVSLVGLSPMGTTLFRLVEDRKTGAVASDVYVDALQKMKPQMNQFYDVVRSVLLTPNEASVPKDLELQTQAGPTQVHFRDYDKHGVPAVVDVENAKFKMKIGVTGYEI